MPLERGTKNYYSIIQGGVRNRSKEAIQRRILELCDKNDLSVNALARVSGITQSTLNNIMVGRNNSTTVSTIQKICDGLTINLIEFFDSDLFRDIEQEVV